MSFKKFSAKRLLACAFVTALAVGTFPTSTYADITVDLHAGASISSELENDSDVMTADEILETEPVTSVGALAYIDEEALVEDVVTVVSANTIEHAVANVENSVNVRTEPSEEADVAGKLFKDCAGTVLESADGWTKIESGNLVGWVSNEFLILGEEAEAKIEEIGTLKATVETETLRVRTEPSEEAGVYELVGTGDVLTAEEELGDWVSVKVDGEIGYVAAEYVSVEFTTEHGKTVEEIEAEEKAAEEAKQKASGSKGTTNRGAVASAGGDVALLAALIQAEAGTQGYEGQLAVGAVVMNRVRSGAYPNSISAVITQPGQFPPATNGTVAGIAARGASSSCTQAAQAAINGASNVGGACHFGRVGKAAGVVIGGHVFY
ncbi:MAG: cell wall hydrolase [Lachnospiraceae bacterium]|nr:cell wall hydrolase [Lachnospiraceae bacterium]